jgi:hypothetical protein
MKDRKKKARKVYYHPFGKTYDGYKDLEKIR